MGASRFGPYLCAVKVSRLLFLPLAAVLLASTLPGCLSLQSEEQKAEAAEKALLARHDELMAQMDQVYALRQQLQKTPGADTVAAGRHRRALVAANAGMLDWMHQYRKPADSVTVDRRLAYYAAQQQRIDSVGHLFRTSLDSARRLLEAAPSTSSSR
ncbi:hypothetical protein SAMN06269173_104119 [Hymenobacter mucosus]|uniref:Uncharacterized protein n=1 Tax=Hymenobacter mucosus TaxID=1411120 RepID=A0A238XHM3_9BACT|nr:hypothetical protein SAMN06269173_104119 [Hymenobacter mucosus]